MADYVKDMARDDLPGARMYVEDSQEWRPIIPRPFKDRKPDWYPELLEEIRKIVKEELRGGARAGHTGGMGKGDSD